MISCFGSFFIQFFFSQIDLFYSDEICCVDSDSAGFGCRFFLSFVNNFSMIAVRAESRTKIVIHLNR